MALPTLPEWAVALEIFGSVAAQWGAAGVTCVVAEGVDSSAEVAEVRARAPQGAVVLTVAVTTSLSSAYERAQKDPSRGLSKKYAFLTGVYETWPNELQRLAADVVIDSAAIPVERAVLLVRDAIDEARASHRASDHHE